MPAPTYTANDFAQALLGLLPRGRAWPKESTALQAQAVSCFAPTFQRLSDSASGLLVGAFPGAATQLLDEWEKTLGLPDPCAGVSPTYKARQNQVRARFANNGGQTPAFFVSYAAGLGYSVTVTQYAPFRAGQSAAGQRVGSEDWYFAWSVAPAAGQTLTDIDKAVLRCELGAMKPAQSTLLFFLD